MSIPLIQYLDVDVDTVRIKFQKTVKYDSIITSAFSLTRDAATPVTISSPFEAVNLDLDYNTVSRTLNLRLTNTLTAGTYTLKISGLRDAAGNIIPDETAPFTAVTVADDHLPDRPVDPDFTVEDYSVLPTAFTELDTVPAEDTETTGLRVLSSDPADDDYHIAEAHNNGVVKIKFSHAVNGIFLTNEYFTVQRKKIQRAPIRWEPVTATISPSGSSVDVALPSTDATPVYNTAGHTYFEKGYKYRIKVHKTIQSGISDSDIDGEYTDGVLDGGVIG